MNNSHTPGAYSIDTRTELIRLELANPTNILRSTLLRYAEHLLGHVSLLKANSAATPGADAERADFEAWVRSVPCFTHFELWQAAQSHARAATPAGADVAADIPTWQKRRDEDIKLNGEALADHYVYMSAEIAALRARIAAGAPAETPPEGEFKLTQSNFDNCPALVLPPTFPQASGTFERLVVLKGADEATAKALLVKLNAAQAAPVQPATGAAPLYFVRPAGETWWKEASEEAYHLFSAKNRRILYDAPQPATGADGQDAKRLDWLESNKATLTRLHDNSKYILAVDGKSIRTDVSARAAIDYAMLAPANSEKPL
jgi:hypothetical protein